MIVPTKFWPDHDKLFLPPRLRSTKNLNIKLDISFNMSYCMGFPIIWYVPPAKPQTSLHIRAV